jgi:hypothetical protein
MGISDLALAARDWVSFLAHSVPCFCLRSARRSVGFDQWMKPDADADYLAGVYNLEDPAFVKNADDILSAVSSAVATVDHESG